MATRRTRTTKMSRSEAGRLGAEARWGKSSSRRSASTRNKSRSTISRSASAKTTRRTKARTTAGQRSGRSALEKYGPEFYSEIGRRSQGQRLSRGVSSPRSRSRTQLERAGRAGAAARWGRGFEEDYQIGGRGISQRRTTTRQVAGPRGGAAASREFYREIGRRGTQARRASSRHF